MMNRRTFLKALSAVPLTAAVPSFAWGINPSAEKRVLMPGSYPELNSSPLKLEGTWPKDLRGTLYRNGPALFERNGYRHPHWFDGDGMVQRFHIDGATTMSHSSRYVKTHKYTAEESAGRFLYNGVSDNTPGSVPQAHNDTSNTASINVQKIGKRVFALWEVGSAYELAPDSLDTLGRHTWGEGLEHMPFSAHPLQDENGSWWNIGSWVFGDKAALLVYHLGSNGELKTYKMLDLDQKGYIHAFAISQRYLVVLNSACLYSQADKFLDGFSFDRRGKSQCVLIDKNSLEIVKTIDLPANFVFHFGTAHEHKGELTVTMAEYPDADFMLKGMQHASPSFGNQPYPSTLASYRINLAKGTWTKEATGVQMEFPQYRLDQPYTQQTLYGTGSSNGAYPGLSNSLVAVNLKVGTTQQFFYGSQTVSEEPLVVRSRTNREYIIQTWLDLKKERSGLAVFRPDAVEEGPIATAALNYLIPLGFHGCFV